MDPKEFEAELKKTLGEIKESVEARDAELKKFGEVSEKTAKEFKAREEKFAQLETELQGFLAERKKVDERVEELEKKLQRRFEQGEERKTLGQQFTESEACKNMIQRKDKRSEIVEIKTITNLAASAGGLVVPFRDPEIARLPMRPRFVRDMFSSIPCQSNSAEFMRMVTRTNNAAPQQPVSPNTNVGGGEGQSKAESNYAWELNTVNLPTMAHWVPVSRQALADAAMLQAEIDGELQYGLALLGDAELLYGDGTNQHLTGIMVDANVSDIGEIANGPDDADEIARAMIDHIRDAITECQTNDIYNITGLILHPTDWAAIEKAKGTDGHYVWVSVPNGGESRLWRVPVTVTNAMTQGDFVLGDFMLGGRIYDRQIVEVRVSDSHAENFVKNVSVILAEERYGLAVRRPTAFTKGSFEVAAS